jgi:hypothetical protein
LKARNRISQLVEVADLFEGREKSKERSWWESKGPPGMSGNGVEGQVEDLSSQSTLAYLLLSQGHAKKLEVGSETW